ncbi:hypothetical protein FOZ61_000907, partial [Perkinsus olseni]
IVGEMLVQQLMPAADLTKSVKSGNLVFVGDIAAAHSELEAISNGRGTRLLRLSPYSFSINLIGDTFSAAKQATKRESGLWEKLLFREKWGNGRASRTKSEYRLQHCEMLFRKGVEAITMHLCIQCFYHVQTLYLRYLSMEDIQV